MRKMLKNEIIFLFLLLPFSTMAQLYPRPNLMHDGRQQATTKRPVDVTVNLSNFILLGVLRVVIHALGVLGFNLHVGTVVGKRSVQLNCPSLILDAMWTGSVIFGGKSEVNCLKRLVCEDPVKGEEKIKAAKLFFGFIKPWFSIEKYEKILKKMELGVSRKKCHHAACANELKML